MYQTSINKVMQYAVYRSLALPHYQLSDFMSESGNGIIGRPAMLTMDIGCMVWLI
jgi:hypothetical protein